MKSQVVEIEIDEGRNGSIHFGPAGRIVRGRFDASRSVRHDQGAAALLNAWPDAIPGQRVGIDIASGEGYIVEPLHDDEHAATRRRIEAKRQKLAAPRQTFAAADVPTWLYWLKRAVESKCARVTRGELPDTIDGEPRKSFHFRPTRDPAERLAEAIERQTEMFGKLLAELAKKR